jgi:hypothetical protein
MVEQDWPHSCYIPQETWEIHKNYPESERRSRWTQYLSSGNSDILLRKEDRPRED